MGAVWCVGCVSFEPVESLRLPVDALPIELAIFADAADAWCEASGRCLDVSLSAEPNVQIDRDCDKVTAQTIVGVGPSVIRLCKEAIRPAIVMHEIGHALAPQRADHLVPGNIMAGSTGEQGKIITSDDVAWVSE